jgi:hypothetical protein
VCTWNWNRRQCHHCRAQCAHTQPAHAGHVPRTRWFGVRMLRICHPRPRVRRGGSAHPGRRTPRPGARPRLAAGLPSHATPLDTPCLVGIEHAHLALQTEPQLPVEPFPPLPACHSRRCCEAPLPLRTAAAQPLLLLPEAFLDVEPPPPPLLTVLWPGLRVPVVKDQMATREGGVNRSR